MVARFSFVSTEIPGYTAAQKSRSNETLEKGKRYIACPSIDRLGRNFLIKENNKFSCVLPCVCTYVL